MTAATEHRPAAMLLRPSAALRPSRAAAVLVFALLVAWAAAPVLPILLAASGRSWFFPGLLPRLDAAAWVYAASPVSGVAAAFGRSLLIALLVVAVSMAVAIPAGRALALRSVPGRRAVLALMIGPALVPGLAIAMGLHGLFLRLGLTGGVAGVVLVHLVPAMPYGVLVTAAVFARFDPAIEDRARTLGASPAQVFRHVTLPMLAPGWALAAALVFLVSWGQYATTAMIGGGRVTTLPLILTQFVAAGRIDVAAVVAILTMAPGLLVLALASRLLAAPGAGRGPR